MSKITKKVIKRHLKKDLLKIAKDNGLDVNKKMTKNVIVDKIFKNKSVRSKVPLKEKRPLSEKQKANLARFRKGSDYKHEEKIKPDAQYIAEIAKIEDVMPEQNHVDEDLKKDIGTGKGQRTETQVQELKKFVDENKKDRSAEANVLTASVNKTSDLFDSEVKGTLTRRTKRRLHMSEIKAKHQADKRFGQDGVVPEPQGVTIAGLENTPIEQLIKQVKVMKQEAKRPENQDKPPNPLLMIIEGLLRQKKKPTNKHN